MTSRTFWSLGLTPAQSWIAEARRSRDLLAGSRILAWLMGRLLVHLKAKGATVRLPELADKDLASLAGSFAKALVAGSSGVSNHASGWVELPLDHAEDLFRDLESQLASLWSDLCGEAAKRSTGEPSCPLQLAWALQEAAASDEEGLSRVDAVYAAVKRSRPIAAHDGTPVRKCGQCGKREIADLPDVKPGLRFDAAELLCPVCALKRFAGYLREEAFPSTSEIASSEWRWTIESAKPGEDLRAALQSLENAAKAVPGYEPDWADRAPLYYRRSASREVRSARPDDAKHAAALDTVREQQKSLLAAIRRYNRHDPDRPVPESPPEYLAVLMLDGDDMGRKLREDLAELPGKVVEFQRRLADLLRNERRLGHPFYLGGDEGLILAPVGVVLELAGRIRQLWEDTAGATATKPTLSMGIALFDRERPLGAAIATARRSLERAKRLDRPCKDGLAVAVQTASGSEWTAIAHWGESWRRIAAAVDLIRNGSLASGWPYDVERFLRTLPEQAFRGDEDSRLAIREEVKRITFRRTLRTALKADVWTGLNGDSWWEDQPAAEELAALADNLHLVAFLARQSGAL